MKVSKIGLCASMTLVAGTACSVLADKPELKTANWNGEVVRPFRVATFNSNTGVAQPLHRLPRRERVDQLLKLTCRAGAQRCGHLQAGWQLTRLVLKWPRKERRRIDTLRDAIDAEDRAE